MKRELYCKHCNFMGVIKTQDAKDYICRFNPPQIVVNFTYTAGMIANVAPHNLWPVVDIEKDWCGKLEYADGTPIITKNEKPDVPELHPQKKTII